MLETTAVVEPGVSSGPIVLVEAASESIRLVTDDLCKQNDLEI